MKMIKKGQEKESILTQEDRFINVSNTWYEVLSIYIDVITEKVIANVNKGYFDEEENFVKETGYRVTIENKEGKMTSRKETLDVKNGKIKTSFKITDSSNVLVFGERNRRIKNFKVLDDYTIEFNKLKSNQVNIKYRSRDEVKNEYSKFMREATSEKKSGNIIISSIRRAMTSGDVKYEVK